jgi:urease accessory protein UreE
MSVLEVFKSVPIVKAVAAPGVLPAECADFAHDRITLGWEERLKARSRRRSDGGLEFATALPRGTVLRQADRLVIEPLRAIVTIVELAEPVLIIEPRTPAEWGLFGYQIGNSHQPLMLTGHEIVCADCLGMEMVLRQHAIPFSRGVRPFTPVGPPADHQH